MIYKKIIEKWDVFEVEALGESGGNPFTEREIKGRFIGAHEDITVNGFYDGDGIYKVRFMPSFEGDYHFIVDGNFGGGSFEGEFNVTPPSKGNHGPVRVAYTYHFAYEDGTPYISIGTTCYVWNLQSDEMVEKTLKMLKSTAFNKIRFCVFPKHYIYNLHEPRSYPYEGTPMDSSVLTEENFEQYTGDTEKSNFNFKRFNPEHFRHIEKCVLRLRELGIEADLIVMHPYDRWGFSRMAKENDALYWKYVLARFSAYRNIWWSLANEYDLMSDKSMEDWEKYAKLICENDPYNHLRSIHNCIPFYDHNRPWITHCSIQRQDVYKTAELVDEWRDKYKKPVVMDEMAYEGNAQYGWGNITGEEMLRRFWETACRGGYPGHGETYMNKDGWLWWSHGGTLCGESWKRFKLLYDIMKENPGHGLKPYEKRAWDEVCAVPETEISGDPYSYYLFYYSFMRPSVRSYYFDDDTDYEVKVIDTWDMVVERIGVFHGRFKVKLPGKQYMAVLIKKIN